MFHPFTHTPPAVQGQPGLHRVPHGGPCSWQVTGSQLRINQPLSNIRALQKSGGGVGGSISRIRGERGGRSNSIWMGACALLPLLLLLQGWVVQQATHCRCNNKVTLSLSHLG